MIKLLIFPLLILTVTIVGISMFLAPNSLLRCSDMPSNLDGCQKADAIITVSGGDTTARTQQAIDLYERGWAETLIFSGAASDKSGPSNAEAMRSQALAQGIPRDAVLIEETSETTYENALNTADILRNEQISSAIIVTSSYHAKRTLLEFQQSSPDVEFRVQPTSSDRQWSVWWWTTPYGWYLALSELVKIMVVYAGASR